MGTTNLPGEETQRGQSHMKYMDAQYAAPLPDGSGARYGNMQRAVSEYRDYLGMCAQLCRDLSDGSVLYPRDLRTAHDQAQGGQGPVGRPAAPGVRGRHGGRRRRPGLHHNTGLDSYGDGRKSERPRMTWYPGTRRRFHILL